LGCVGYKWATCSPIRSPRPELTVALLGQRKSGWVAMIARHLALDSTFGMQITDEGRKYLRGVQRAGFERG